MSHEFVLLHDFSSTSIVFTRNALVQFRNLDILPPMQFLSHLDHSDHCSQPLNKNEITPTRIYYPELIIKQKQLLTGEMLLERAIIGL